MKSTGIIRKIDELGRLVIPKEIRKNLSIHNGEDIEFFMEEEKIILKKYQRMLSIKEQTQKYIDLLSKTTSNTIFITDKETIISSSIKGINNSKLDSKIVDCMNERKKVLGRNIKIGDTIYNENYLISPFIVDADAIGSIIIIKEKEINEEDKLLVNILKVLIEGLVY